MEGMSGRDVGVGVRRTSGDGEADIGLAGVDGRHPIRLARRNRMNILIRRDPSDVFMKWHDVWKQYCGFQKLAGLIPE
jgi:hypothetical protein